MMKFKTIFLTAPDSFGRGEEYGRRTRQEIGLCLDSYKKHFMTLRNLSWEEARKDACEYLPLVSGALPQETEMLRGVAAGSGYDFEDIMVLNTRYEILHYPAGASAPGECTSFAVLREASKDKKVYVGQNWDQHAMVVRHSVVLGMKLEDGTKIIGLTEAGQLLRNGMNSHGIGLASNSLHSSFDEHDLGIPGNFMRMRVLRSKSYAEMAEYISSVHRSVANNYCIASAENLAVDIEAIPKHPGLIYPKNGIVAHANHIVSNPEFDTSHGKKFRGERLWALLEAKRGEITLDYIKECLRDHQGYPESVCSHPHSGNGATDDPYKVWQTVASLIYDLDSLTMDLCCCNPCENEYSQIRLADIK